MKEMAKVNTKYMSTKDKELIRAIYGLDDNYVIDLDDFDTCGKAYSKNVINNLQGYRDQYNTYLDQFENC